MIPIRRDKDGALLVPLKVVPGAKRDQIVGRLGDRLKVRVTAPPEQWKANHAIVALLADALGVPKKSVSIAEGHASPEKLLRVAGIDEAIFHQRLGPTASSR